MRRHFVAMIGLLGVFRLAAQQPLDLGAKVSGKIEAALKKSGAPGVSVAVVADGKIAFAKAFGKADIARGREADVTTRGNNGWKATAGTLKEGSIEFEMVWDTEDEGFTAVKDAYFGNTAIGLAAMDGDIETAGSQGLWADCMITNFSRDEALEEAITVKVTAKPTYSTNAPQWKTIEETPAP